LQKKEALKRDGHVGTYNLFSVLLHRGSKGTGTEKERPNASGGEGVLGEEKLLATPGRKRGSASKKKTGNYRSGS